MNKLLRKRLSNQRGVTLIELLAVIVILGIIAAVAVPVVLNNIDDAKAEKLNTSGTIIVDAAQRFFMDEANTTTTEGQVTLTELETAKYLKNVPEGYLGTDLVKKSDLKVYATGGTTVKFPAPAPAGG